ncbi:MAG: NADPH-dependent oxidoreductase [Tindallia sp. MSAO_Bac2]|nr:MAG: NADPH-dependent oxidoreductase [Tindallia sp. MSAO_Bac2]
MLKVIDQINSSIFEKCTAMLVVRSSNEWFTKSFSAGLIFLLNQRGCRFIGHPLLEMTKGLNNLNRWERTSGIPREKLIYQMGEQSIQRLIHFKPIKHVEPRITVLHASSKKTSNTLQLWHMVKSHLSSMHIDEFHVENGTLIDCIGCRYQTCLYYGRQKSCFYGGDMIKEILPAMEKADALVWVCPNYNDALSANLTAVINRMTALYRTMSFYDKSIFSVIVSGNSGSDSVARQLIGALNINKGFQLPPHFCITATAYEPGSIMDSPNIEKRAADFAALIKNTM